MWALGERWIHFEYPLRMDERERKRESVRKLDEEVRFSHRKIIGPQIWS